MDWTQVFQLISALLASVGGAGAIIIAVSSWLGKVWANRLMEKDRAQHSKELEALKNQYSKELEEYRTRLGLIVGQLQRYYGRQFELYSVFWVALYDLKLAADDLWEEATPVSLLAFADQLRKTSQAIHRGALFLEEQHYAQLKRVLDAFSQFEMGKARLIDVRSQEDLVRSYGGSELYIIQNRIRNQIAANRAHKQTYDVLIERIREDFVSQLRQTRIDIADTGAG